MLEQLNRLYEDSNIRIEIRHSRKARRISIAVKRSGDVTLTIPVGVEEKSALKFLESKSEWIITTVEQQRAKPQSPQLTIEQLNEYIVQANSYLPERIKQISQNTGLKYNNLSITKARTRWGSCSSRCDISLSFHLMRLPKHLIDFVIIHELCHTVYHNHSAEFHALVNHHTNGQETQLEREIRNHKI